MNIQVVGLRFLPGDRPLKGFADIQLGDLILKDFRVMKDNGGKPYVKAPFTTYRDKTGQLRFRQIIDLPAEVRGRIDNMILSEYNREKDRRNDRRSECPFSTS